MTTFGISAFLRILHLNARPQRTELRRRFTPREGGYDFHGNMRRHAHLMMLGGTGLEATIAATTTISREAERNSAQQALRRLHEWRTDNPGEISTFDQVTWKSPEGRFAVTFRPNFGLRIGSETAGIHLWNTALPRLESRLVRGVLSLFVDSYRGMKKQPDDLAVLCLRTMRLIRLADASEVTEIGQLIAARVDQIFAELEREDRLPPAPLGDRPPAPPPAE